MSKCELSLKVLQIANFSQITHSLLAVGRQFTVQNPSELYVLVSSALPTTRRDMTCTVLKAT